MEEFPYTLSELTVSSAIIWGIVIGLTEVSKRILKRFVNEETVNDFAPVISIFWGLVYAFWAYLYGAISSPVAVIFVGTIFGLSAAGVWDVGKRTIKNGILNK